MNIDLDWRVHTGCVCGRLVLSIWRINGFVDEFLTM